MWFRGKPSSGAVFVKHGFWVEFMVGVSVIKVISMR
jgi:hypothetical protein